VLVLSMYAEELYAMRALKAGAQGYVNKDSATEELVRAVRKVAAGGCYLSSSMAEKVAMSLTHHEDTPRHDRLTDREFEIFRRIVGGQRVSDISRAIHLSIKTVSTHKSRILQKMHLDSTAALIRYGLEHRLFNDGSSLEEAHGHEPRHVLGTAPAASASPRQGTLTF
jgi:DNA-binding NarL/FixJ family response regulator